MYQGHQQAGKGEHQPGPLRTDRPTIHDGSDDECESKGRGRDHNEMDDGEGMADATRSNGDGQIKDPARHQVRERRDQYTGGSGNKTDRRRLSRVRCQVASRF